MTTSLSQKYNEDYFERGNELGISGYTNYSWMPERTIPCCYRIIKHCGIELDHTILDFGAGKGFYVKAFRLLGHKAYGFDISQYALSQCPKEIEEFMMPTLMGYYDWAMAKDVLEHIEYKEIDNTIQQIRNVCRNLFVVVPLGKDGKYIVPSYDDDITHIIREDLDWWSAVLEKNNFKIKERSHRVEGVKDNYSNFEYGNGFFVCGT